MTKKRKAISKQQKPNKCYKFITGPCLGEKATDEQVAQKKVQHDGRRKFNLIGDEQVVPTSAFAQYRPLYFQGPKFGEQVDIKDWKQCPKPTNGMPWMIKRCLVIEKFNFNHQRPRYFSGAKFGKLVDIADWKAHPKPSDDTPWMINEAQVIENSNFNSKRPRYLSGAKFGELADIADWGKHLQPSGGTPWMINGSLVIEAYKFWSRSLVYTISTEHVRVCNKVMI